MANESEWVVTLSGDRGADAVRQDLLAAGFNVGETLESIGVLTGRASEEAAERARGVRGVEDVAPEQPIDIGPPGSPETW